LLEGKAQEIAGELSPRNISNLLWAFATMERQLGRSLMGKLESEMMTNFQFFAPQHYSITMWAFGMMRMEPGEEMWVLMERRGVEVSRQRDFSPSHINMVLTAYSKLEKHPGPELLRALEQKIETTANDFSGFVTASILLAYARMSTRPSARVLEVLEHQVETTASDMVPTSVAFTLYAFATLGCVPGDIVLEELRQRVEVVAQELDTAYIAMILWTVCFLSIHLPVAAGRLVKSLAPHLSRVDQEQSRVVLSEMHQFFVSCDLEEQLRAGLPASVVNLRETLGLACRAAFVLGDTLPSARYKSSKVTRY